MTNQAKGIESGADSRLNPSDRTPEDEAILLRRDRVPKWSLEVSTLEMLNGDRRDAAIMRKLAMHYTHGSYSVHADLCVNGVSRPPPYPQFCLDPEECAGKSCCPRAYSCCE